MELTISAPSTLDSGALSHTPSRRAAGPWEGRMNRLVRFSSWQAALWSGMLLAGCAPPTDYSGITTSPITMVCDGGRNFTINTSRD